MACRTDREKVIARCRALLAKTVANGCTEGEALAALSKAREIMGEYEITEHDLNFGGEQITRETIVRTDHDEVRSRLTNPVGRFCHCAGWKEGGLFDAITYCGLQSEVVFAHWMLDMLADYVIRSADNYKVDGGRPRRRERKSFILGCVGRIAERLEELAQQSSTGTDLVICRQSLIDAYMAQHGIRLREPFRLDRIDVGAYEAGSSAGDSAQFNRPMGVRMRGLLR